MKWDVSYTKKTTGETIFYSQDNELNCLERLIDASSETEALNNIKTDISELFFSNCLEVEEQNNEIVVYEPCDHEFIECYYNFTAVRVYFLLNENGEEYPSFTPGTIGGNKKLKIYGRLDCPSALRHIASGNYVQHRVFFPDERTAIAAGYRPCAKCMKEEYKKWKEKSQV